MICPRCLNSDEKYFYKYNGSSYCRKCIAFGKVEVGTRPTTKVTMYTTNVDYHLDYSLTKKQKEISQQIVERFKHKEDTVLKAVCGAGKTEILYAIIKYALNNQQRVCFTTPRKELVIELAKRMTTQFSHLDYSLVYGGHTSNLDGQFVICTCHQLFRYPKAFDLLILDEGDAFPYKGNEVLQNILQQSIKGNYVFMSATFGQEEAMLLLNKRYHNYPMPEPKCRVTGMSFSLMLMLFQVKAYIQKKQPVLIYVPTIKETMKIVKLLKMFRIRCCEAHSKTDTIQQAILDLKATRIDAIVCTTILERGITIENIQVIVLQGHHRVYDRDTLLQICGRVGRKEKYPRGDITIYTVYKTKEIRQCIKTIKIDNA